MTCPQGLDRISVSGISAHGRHGVLEHERRVGQPFVVDLVLGLDTGPAAAADDLSRTVDYGSLTLEVHDVIASEPVDLIETLAQRIADRVLAHDLVQWTEVTVHKPAAPIAVAFDDVAVTIERSRT
ncbi:dihydroneopterin aldolase [Nocardioidaceae bacterium SCSIO 66511]|nr:dihydroneopterin aldolase [Nocardioidaceae bacterium SCSIO 66511]